MYPSIPWSSSLATHLPFHLPLLHRLCVENEIGDNVRIEVDTAVRELAEGSLLLDLSSLLGVLQFVRVSHIYSTRSRPGHSQAVVLVRFEDEKELRWDRISTYVFVSHDCGDGGLSRSRWSICVRWRISRSENPIWMGVDLVKVVWKAGLTGRGETGLAPLTSAKKWTSAQCVGLSCPLSPAHVTVI